MRRLRRAFIPHRRRVFLGCEGESERDYGALLGRLVETQRRDVYLDVVLLKPGGGDPLAIVERALVHIDASHRKRGARYVICALLLDGDRRGQAPDRDAQMEKLAADAKLRLIWQNPCHEALPLRHFEGCQHLRPPTSERAIAELRRRWPQYNKGMSAKRLAEQIGESDVRRVLEVELELASFLSDIGFT
jgi:RloB-like protein